MLYVYIVQCVLCSLGSCAGWFSPGQTLTCQVNYMLETNNAYMCQAPALGSDFLQLNILIERILEMTLLV